MYINFVELEAIMLHAKFQDHRISGSGDFLKVFTIYWHGGHLGDVTCTIYIYPPPTHIIVALIGLMKMFEHCGRTNYMLDYRVRKTRVLSHKTQPSGF